MSNYRSIVHVQYKDGSKPKGAKVTLGFGGLFGGVTKAFYTDRDGRAIIEHASKGNATIYVRGSKRGTFKAPGETVVFI